MLSETWIFIFLISAGCFLIGTGVGAYVQNYYTARAMLEEHHKFTMKMMHELAKEIGKDDN